MYRHVLSQIRTLGPWGDRHAESLAAALYADIRGKQPHLGAGDLGNVLPGLPGAERPSLFATPRSGYHHHANDPARLVFSAPLAVASISKSDTLAPFRRLTTIDKDGYLTDPGITHTPIAAISHAGISRINGIVLHRTASSTAAGTLSTWRTRESGTGAHFLIDRDGTIHQTVSVNRQAWHVGAIRSRGEVEGTLTPEDARDLAAARGGQAAWRTTAVRAVSRLEATRPYPERYPTNADSLGIEVVARYHPATETWDAPTPEQRMAIGRLMESLQRNFGLTHEDIYEHDAISRKTPGEGAGLYQPAGHGLDTAPAGTGQLPTPQPQR